MSFWKKLFSSNISREKTNALLVYLDADLKKSVEVKDQTVKQYQLDSNFDEDQFLYLLILNKKVGEVVLKRKLNSYERFSQCLVPPNDDCKCYLVVGYGSERSTIPKISSTMPIVQNMRFIRSGVLTKYNDLKNAFEECQLKLHHDYLTFYKFKETGRIRLKQRRKCRSCLWKIQWFRSSTKKNACFRSTTSLTAPSSKQAQKKICIPGNYDVKLVAITEAIKIRNSQIYMNEMEDKLQKAIKGRINNYVNKCTNLKDNSRVIPLDDIGRKALKAYFRKHKVQQKDAKLLSIIEAYLHMCKIRREKGQLQSQQIYMQIRHSIQQMQAEFPKQIELRDLESKNEFVKTIEQIMKYLDGKYRKQIVDKKNIYSVFENYLFEQYRQDRKIPVKTLMRKDPDF